MKNADVEMGQAYVWSRHKPGLHDKGVKVTALALEIVTGTSNRRVSMVRVRYETPVLSWSGQVTVPAGTEGHVPARELWGDYDEWAARVDGFQSRKDEGQRLKAEIMESLEALGVQDPKVWPRVGGAGLGLTIEVRDAADIQAISDALALALAARG